MVACWSNNFILIAFEILNNLNFEYGFFNGVLFFPKAFISNSNCMVSLFHKSLLISIWQAVKFIIIIRFKLAILAYKICIDSAFVYMILFCCFSFLIFLLLSVLIDSIWFLFWSWTFSAYVYVTWIFLLSSLSLRKKRQYGIIFHIII